jgi:hypothetical protein
LVDISIEKKGLKTIPNGFCFPPDPGSVDFILQIESGP